jgi:pyruvate/2-oxoglutarate dehydrogenase complex dihydrolipoamide acyltransferase (E2) component
MRSLFCASPGLPAVAWPLLFCAFMEAMNRSSNGQATPAPDGRTKTAPSKDSVRVAKRAAGHGAFRVERATFERQLAMDAFAALPPNHPMIALLELDVTDALAAIAAQRAVGTRVSLFAFLVRSIARAISEHPDLNLVRHGKKLVRFEDVDVSVPVEVTTRDGNFPRELVLRRAHARGATDLYAELEAARTGFGQSGDLGAEDKGYRRAMGLLRWLPGFVRAALMRLFIRSAFRIKQSAGTTLVTSVGKFASMPGFGFTFTTGPRAAAFAVGTVSEKPWVHEGQICVRSILGFSIIVNHDLLDGAPVARFARRLQELVERPCVD